MSYRKKAALCMSSLVLILLFLFSVRLYIRNHERNSDAGNTSFNILGSALNDQRAKEEKKYQAIFDSEGSKKATERFVADSPSIPVNLRQYLEHWFGMMLFQHDGLAGIHSCDQMPSSLLSCYHGFLGVSLTKDRDSVVRQIETLCHNDENNIYRSDSCIHGYGHGLLYYYGYTADGVKQSIADCNRLETNHTKQMCSTGVFMEYNKGMMDELMDKDMGMGMENKFNRERTVANPFYPCDIIPNLYQQPCYYELPYWWNDILGPNTATFDAYCMKVAPVNRESCFRGIGKVVAFTDSLRKNGCSKIKDPAAKAWCVTEEALILVQSDVHYSLEACNQLQNEARSSCIKAGKKKLCGMHNECN